MSAALSPELQRFVLERLPSMEQIEIVLLLRAETHRSWSSPEVSQQLGTPPESTAMRLFLLASNGILIFESSGVPRYRFSIDDPITARLFDELAAVHQSRRHLLYELLGTTPADPIRSFADAFRLKK